MADEMEMPENMETDEVSGTVGYKESDFIPLDDLVYAPLHALALSNQQLRAQVVDAIKSMGTVKRNGTEESVCLDNLNIAYEQVRPEGDEGYTVDNLQMQVPLLSIVPITNLNVENAEIDFSTEVKAEKNEDGKCDITARICSPEQRESDFLPRVSYKMKITSLPATEAVMRITDQLSSNQIAKRLDSTPVAVDGNLGSDEQKGIMQDVSKLKAKIKKFKQLYQKISDMITEQENMLQLSQEGFEEDTWEFDKDKYLMAQSNIANRIMEYQEQIMNKEIEYGLNKDYE
jgi:predicted transcriptional regulator